MIMIVARRDDFHAFVARHMLREDFGADCEILELAAFPHKVQLSLEIHSGGHRVKHRADQYVDWSDVSTVWWRCPQPHFASDFASEAPVIVQEQLPAGLDIRVNIFGAEVYSAAKQVETVDGRLDPRIWQITYYPTLSVRSS